MAFTVEEIFTDPDLRGAGRPKIIALKFTLKTVAPKKIPSSWFNFSEDHKRILKKLLEFVVAKSTGRITNIYVKENDLVDKNQVLAAIENNAEYNDIQEVKLLINDFKQDNINYKSLLNRRKILKLGSVQQDYSAFKESLNALYTQEALTPEIKELREINKEIGEYKKLLEKQKSQLELFWEEQLLLRKDLDRNVQLYSVKAIAEKGLEDNMKDFISFQRSIENVKISISNTQIKIVELQKTGTQLDIKNHKYLSELNQDINEKYNALISAIIDWENKYLLKSSIVGEVSFFNIWNENQFLREGDEVFTIIPSAKQKIMGKAYISSQKSGKVKVNQIVKISLDGYPFEEFGTISGTIINISPVPKNGKYAVDVELNKGLTTSYHKKLSFMQDMKGKMEIITEDLRLIDRFFFSIRREIN